MNTRINYNPTDRQVTEIIEREKIEFSQNRSRVASYSFTSPHHALPLLSALLSEGYYKVNPQDEYSAEGYAVVLYFSIR